MKTSTRKSSLEKTKDALSKIREREKELLKKQKSLEAAKRNKDRRDERKKRTHALILIGEFCDRVLYRDKAVLANMKRKLLYVMERLQEQKEKEIAANADKDVKKTERMINNYQIILEWVEGKEAL